MTRERLITNSTVKREAGFFSMPSDVACYQSHLGNMFSIIRTISDLWLNRNISGRTQHKPEFYLLTDEDTSFSVNILRFISVHEIAKLRP